MEGNSVDVVAGSGDRARTVAERAAADPVAGPAARYSTDDDVVRAEHEAARDDEPRVLLYSMVDVHDLGGVQAVMRQILDRLPNGSSLCPPCLALKGRRWIDSILFRVNEITAGCVAAALIAARRPRIVNLHFISGPIRPLILLKSVFGFRLVLSAHGSDILGRDLKRRGELALLLKRADAVTVVSSGLQASLLFDYQVAPRKVRLIPNGVDCAFWTPGTPAVSPSAQASIVAIGRLHSVKGFDILLDAFAELLAEGRALTLRIVGDGPDRGALEAQAMRLGIVGHVEFTGAKEPLEVRRLLRDAAVFAMPSKSEGMPLALLEAMACGRPVVATQVGGIPDIVARGTGILVAANDVGAFADGLRRVLDAPQAAEAMARRATVHAKRFAGAQAVTRYLALYTELLQTPRPSPTRFDALRTGGARALQAVNRGLRFIMRRGVPAGALPGTMGWRAEDRAREASRPSGSGSGSETPGQHAMKSHDRDLGRTGPAHGGRRLRAAGRRRTTVSVIVPCLDAERYLPQTLGAVLNQTEQPLEVLVVDNGSRDQSPELVEAFGPPVRLLREPRPGAAQARITGAAAARGEALMFLDADDLIAPGTLAALTRALGREPTEVAICPWRRWVWTGPADDPAPGLGPRGCWLPAPPSCAPHRPNDDDLAAWLSGWWHPPCSVLWSRPAYLRSGGWDGELAVNQDGDLMLRGLVAGNRLLRAADGMGFYRRLPGGGSVSAGRFSHDGVRDRIAVIQRIEGQLAARGNHERYTRPLAEAYRLIAEGGAAPFADMAETCHAAVARLRGTSARRSPRPAPWRRPPPLLGAVRTAAKSAVIARLPQRSSAPLVSVVIPTWNRQEMVLRAIASVQAQQYPALEILVVDDASTDDTAARVAELPDPRVRLIRMAENGGVARARNQGMAEARGELIAFLDSDDEWLPDKLTRQVACLASASRRTGIVCGGVEVTGVAGRVIALRPQEEGRVFPKMLARNLLPGFCSNGLIRREVMEAIGGFDPSLPAIEDWEFLIRATRLFDVALVHEPLSRYHDGPSSLADGVATPRRSLQFAANMTARRLLYRRYGQDMRAAGAEIPFLKDSARRHLAAGLRGRWPASEALLRALRREPWRLDLYAWLVSFGLPRGLAKPLRQRFSADMPEVG